MDTNFTIGGSGPKYPTKRADGTARSQASILDPEPFESYASVQLTNAANYPALLGAARSTKVERVFKPDQAQGLAFESGLKVSGDTVLGIEGASLTIFAKGGHGMAFLSSNGTDVPLDVAAMPVQGAEPGDIENYKVGLPDGTSMEISSYDSRQISVTRYSGDYENNFDATFYGEDSEGFKLTQASFSHKDPGSQGLVNVHDPMYVPEISLIQNRDVGSSIFQRSLEADGPHARMLESGETYVEPPKVVQMELGLMADKVMSSTAFLTTPHGLWEYNQAT